MHKIPITTIKQQNGKYTFIFDKKYSKQLAQIFLDSLTPQEFMVYPELHSFITKHGATEKFREPSTQL